MRSLWIVLFATAAGFTASGIVAGFYRMLGLNDESRGGRFVRTVVMVAAGPIVIFEAAVKGFRTKQWTPAAFWLTVAAVTYWSLALGLFILDVAVHI